MIDDAMRRRARRCVDRAREGVRLRQCRNDRMHRRRGRGLLLPGDEHAAPGGAHRHRDGDGYRHRGAADRGRDGRASSTSTRVPRGAAIQCRINAEDPGRNFLPGARAHHAVPGAERSVRAGGRRGRPRAERSPATTTRCSRSSSCPARTASGHVAACSGRSTSSSSKGVPTTIPVHGGCWTRRRSGPARTPRHGRAGARRGRLPGTGRSAATRRARRTKAGPPTSWSRSTGTACPFASSTSAATWRREPPKSHGRAPRRARARGDRAPMQGTIVKVLVEKGQEIRAGEVVCILEAMKMENHIPSTRDGEVTELPIRRRPGRRDRSDRSPSSTERYAQSLQQLLITSATPGRRSCSSTNAMWPLCSKTSNRAPVRSRRPWPPCPHHAGSVVSSRQHQHRVATSPSRSSTSIAAVSAVAEETEHSGRVDRVGRSLQVVGDPRVEGVGEVERQLVVHELDANSSAVARPPRAPTRRSPARAATLVRSSQVRFDAAREPSRAITPAETSGRRHARVVDGVLQRDERTVGMPQHRVPRQAHRSRQHDHVLRHDAPASTSPASHAPNGPAHADRPAPA